jgi:protein phosphatase PTC2/3
MVTEVRLHGILVSLWSNFVGDRVAKYAGENVHQIVRKQQAFDQGDYVKALQDGFIATDTALLEGMNCVWVILLMTADRHYEDEPSGCTATAVLITEKNVLYVVCISLVHWLT